MNKLKSEKQQAVISALVEGASVRSTERMTGVHRDTICRLLVRVGNACEAMLDEKMRNLSCRRIEVDEIWSYVGKKQGHLTKQDDTSKVGDFYTWVALDAETKLVPSYLVGKRDGDTGNAFMDDLASRLRNRVQISSDGLRVYAEAAERIWGVGVDYATIVKSYQPEALGSGRYSPPKVSSVQKEPRIGWPDMDTVSTSYVERQNLTMRMSMRRFTRLTNGFSKKAENLRAAVSLHFAHYNMVRIHRSLRVTPAMEAGVEDRPWKIADIVDLAS